MKSKNASFNNFFSCLFVSLPNELIYKIFNHLDLNSLNLLQYQIKNENIKNLVKNFKNFKSVKNSSKFSVEWRIASKETSQLINNELYKSTRFAWLHENHNDASATKNVSPTIHTYRSLISEDPRYQFRQGNDHEYTDIFIDTSIFNNSLPIVKLVELPKSSPIKFNNHFILKSKDLIAKAKSNDSKTKSIKIRPSWYVKYSKNFRHSKKLEFEMLVLGRQPNLMPMYQVVHFSRCLPYDTNTNDDSNSNPNSKNPENSNSKPFMQSSKNICKHDENYFFINPTNLVVEIPCQTIEKYQEVTIYLEYFDPGHRQNQWEEFEWNTDAEFWFVDLMIS